MTTKVFKYSSGVMLGIPFTIELPKGYSIVHTELSLGHVTVWAEIDDTVTERVSLLFCVYGTGWEINEDNKFSDYCHVKTFNDGGFMWHLYELF